MGIENRIVSIKKNTEVTDPLNRWSQSEASHWYQLVQLFCCSR